MGEDPATVFNVGCPSIDLVAKVNFGTRQEALETFGGAGSPIDPEKPFLLMMQHPVTTEYGRGFEQINATLNAVSSLGDADARVLAQRRCWLGGGREGHPALPRGRPRPGLPLLPQPPPETFLRLMAHCACIVGNSSAALREARSSELRRSRSARGSRTASAGERRRTSNDADEIADAIRDQMRHGPYERTTCSATEPPARGSPRSSPWPSRESRSSCTTT